MHDGSCSCPHHKVVPTLVIVIGLSFLLTSLEVIDAGLRDIIWPIAIILIGLMKITGGMCSCCKMK